MSENHFIYLLVFVYFGGMMKKCHHGNLSHHSKWSTQIMAEEDKEIPQYQHFQPAKIKDDSEEKYKSSKNTKSPIEYQTWADPMQHATKRIIFEFERWMLLCFRLPLLFHFHLFRYFLWIFFDIWSFVCNVF